MIHRTLALICLSSLLAAASHALMVANLVENPDFDAGIAGWSDPGAVSHIAHGDADEAGTPGSGSLRLDGLAASTSIQSKSECFPVNPGQPLAFGASSLSEGLVYHTTTALVQFWSNATCTGDLMGGESIASDLHGHPAYTWVPLQGYGAVPPGAQAARLALTVLTEAALPPAIYFDNAYVYEGLTCARAAMVACLNESRFRFTATWKTPEGMHGQALVKAFPGASDSAYATFFSPSNVELVVKVLDGCGLNERFWVFASGLTNVETKLTVKDTFEGTQWVWVNPPNETFLPILDTAAFATCPH